MKTFRREKTPVMIQMDSSECGAVVLAMMLAYFHRYVPSSEVREACGVSRDGSKAINIIKAARKYGLEAHGLQLSLEAVQELPPPFIVYWQFNHFLIVEGFDKDKVYLNDPATGPRTVTMKEFAVSFTGVVLFMNPGPDFKTGGQAEPGIIQMLWQRLTGSRSQFFYIIFITLALSIPLIGVAVFAKIFFDDILLANQHNWLPGLLIGMAIAALSMALLTGLRRYYLIRLYFKLKLTGMSQFFWRLLHLPLSFFQQRANGDITERIESHSYLADMLTNKLSSNLADLFGLILLGAVMIVLSPLLAIVTILVAVINFLLLLFLSGRNITASQRFAQIEGQLASIEMNGIQIIETLKANTVEDQFFNHWAAVHARKVNSEQAMAVTSWILKILPALSQGFNMIVLLGLGGWLIMHQQLTPGGLIAMQILLISFNRPLLELLEMGEHYFKLRGEIARIADVNDQNPENILSKKIEALPDEGPMRRIETDILEFRHIEFGYSRLEPPILVDISLQVQLGQRIAIVGPTGGGKSSIAKLICGLFAPWSGEILVKGVPLAHISRADLAEWVGLVDQNIFLFAASVRENLTLWNPKISDAQIYQALKLADMDEIIRARGGLNCRVEEFGKNFSGGQVQRLEIARALIANPQLLVLDEATSALDPLVEQKIYTNLRQQGSTLIIIAHRLSAIRDCDQILVINEGKIVQQGRHETLIHDSGLYKDLVSLEIQ